MAISDPNASSRDDDDQTRLNAEGARGAGRGANDNLGFAFESVRKTVRELARDAVAKRLKAQWGPHKEIDFEDPYVAGRCADVEYAGMLHFDFLLRLYGGETTFAWREEVLAAITRAVSEVFDGPDHHPGSEGDDPGAPTPDRKPPTRPGGGGSAATAPGTPSGSRGVAGSRTLLATPAHLWTAASKLAQQRIASKIGSWSYDSEATEDVRQTVVLKAVDRCLRLWDAERSPLIRYLDRCVESVTLDQYRQLCQRKRRGTMIAQEYERVSREDLRVGAHSDEQDPTKAYLREDVQDPFADLRPILAARIQRLSPAQREELDRRTREGTAGTNAQQLRMSRAMHRLLQDSD